MTRKNKPQLSAEILIEIEKLRTGSFCDQIMGQSSNNENIKAAARFLITEKLQSYQNRNKK